MILLALAAVVAYMDRVNLSVAVIDGNFKKYLNLDNTGRGLVSSAFFWSYALCQIPAGWVVDRYGSKWPLAVFFAAWSVLTTLTGLVAGFASLFALRLLVGFCESVMHPASLRWIRFNFPESRRGLAIGVFMSGSKLGPAIGAVASAWLIEQLGWRWMFVVLGVGALVWLIPWALYVRDDLGSSAAGPIGPQEDSPTRHARPIGGVVLWGTVIGTFCYMYFVYFSLTWMPAYLSESRGLSLQSSGLFTTFSFAGMAVMSVVGGCSADALINKGWNPIKVRRGFTILGFLLACTELIGARSTSLQSALVFSVLSLSGLGLATANYWALTQSLASSRSIGRVVGIQNCAASVAGIVAPIVTGWLIDKTGAYTAPMQTVLVFLALGIVAYAFLVRERPVTKGSQDAPFA